jgi:hypothetical protein
MKGVNEVWMSIVRSFEKYDQRKISIVKYYAEFERFMWLIEVPLHGRYMVPPCLR